MAYIVLILYYVSYAFFVTEIFKVSTFTCSLVAGFVFSNYLYLIRVFSYICTTFWSDICVSDTPTWRTANYGTPFQECFVFYSLLTCASLHVSTVSDRQIPFYQV